MNTNKVLMGTVAGGIASFLLGWLIYGVLMTDFMATHYNDCMARPDHVMIWWALIISNFMYAALLAVIISWSNMATLTGGITIGAVTGLLVGLSYDLSFYAMSTMFTSLKVAMFDAFIGMVYAAVVGAVVGFVMGMGKKG